MLIFVSDAYNIQINFVDCLTRKWYTKEKILLGNKEDMQ